VSVSHLPELIEARPLQSKFTEQRHQPSRRRRKTLVQTSRTRRWVVVFATHLASSLCIRSLSITQSTRLLNCAANVLLYLTVQFLLCNCFDSHSSPAQSTSQFPPISQFPCFHGIQNQLAATVICHSHARTVLPISIRKVGSLLRTLEIEVV